MARLIHKETKAKAISPQFTREIVLKCYKSLEYDPKPSDLILGKVKWDLGSMEA